MMHFREKDLIKELLDMLLHNYEIIKIKKKKTMEQERIVWADREGLRRE